MLEPKRIPKEAIPAAMEKALRYRLLNEPAEAESICRDVLLVDPNNQAASIALLLAVTDQFEAEFTTALDEAKQVLQEIDGDYEQAYYEGIINERWAKAQLVRGLPGEFAFGWLREAMRCYERAEQLSKPDDPDALLRWNTCARFLEKNEQAKASYSSLTHDVEAGFGDDVPPR
jgi:tetratricopeptide (TPR) repeat protein